MNKSLTDQKEESYMMRLSEKAEKVQEIQLTSKHNNKQSDTQMHQQLLKLQLFNNN